MKRNLFIGLFVLFTLCGNGQDLRIADIVVKGAKKTKLPFIKKIIHSKEGFTLDSLTLAEDINQLKRLPAIAHAYYQVFCKQNNSCTVQITLEEQHTLIPEVNLWTTTNNVFSYKLGLYDYHFLGQNITLGGFYQFNGFDTYAIHFRAPQLFSKKWGFTFNHQNWKSEEPLYFGDLTANYLYNNISFETLILHRINTRNRMEVGLTFFEEHYQYLSGFTDSSIPQDLSLDKLLFKGVYTYENLNYNYQYLDGFKSQLFLQYVVTENDFQNDFFIFWNDLFYFKRIGVRGNWANRLRFGLSSNQNSPFAPFALDNNVNLRGVGILVDRGTGSIVLNSEYRYTILDKKGLAIQTNLFTDMGSWRNPGGKLNDFIEQRNIRIYSGVGLRLIGKKIYNATFRIDYGFSVLNQKGNSKGGFVFGIGQYF